jgi:hypothetical protein
MAKSIYVLSFMFVWTAVTLFGLLWGFNYNWSDFAHVDYGLPLTWATNTLGTIVGPVDQWSVNIMNLLLDLLFWLSIMIVGAILLIYKLKA